jgi:hypothetical protein
MSAEPRQRIPLMDESNAEEWERLTDDPDLGGVEACRSEDDGWRVTLGVAEFVRREPLESELVAGVEAAIRSVPGVTGVWHEDREQWVARGTPSSRPSRRLSTYSLNVHSTKFIRLLIL